MLLISNPRLIWWPNSFTSLVYAKPDGGVMDIGPVPDGLLRFLKSWRNPTSINEVAYVLRTNRFGLTPQSLLERQILIPTEDASEPEGWEGLRLSDIKGTLSPIERDGLEIEERPGVDFPVFVIDYSLNAACMETLARWFARQSFALVDIDSERANFNKHWVRPLDPRVERLLNAPLLGWIDAICRLCMPSLALRLVEVKAYATPYGDVPTYHQDSEIGPTVTGVLYCHSEWQQDWGGELVIADSSGEPKIAIGPKPGRLIVFRGDLPHKAGVPSRFALFARQTLVYRYNVLQ